MCRVAHVGKRATRFAMSEFSRDLMSAAALKIRHKDVSDLARAAQVVHYRTTHQSRTQYDYLHFAPALYILR
jgi:hypothetical protein